MKKWLNILFWTVFSILVVLVFGFASKQQKMMLLNVPTINLEVQDEIVMLTNDELLSNIKVAGYFYDSMSKIDLNVQETEAYIRSLNEVQDADVFVNLNGNWVINAKLKRPLVRVVNDYGSDFYIDNRGGVMLISSYAKPRVLPVTNMSAILGPNFNIKEVINNDSLKTILKLDQIYRISKYVCSSVFYDAQIVQIHFSPQDGFILIPRVGKQKIIFGMAESDEAVAKKFEKLTTFYEEVIPYEGWDTYKLVNLKFENQIVAQKK